MVRDQCVNKCTPFLSPKLSESSSHAKESGWSKTFRRDLNWAGRVEKFRPSRKIHLFDPTSASARVAWTHVFAQAQDPGAKYTSCAPLFRKISTRSAICAAPTDVAEERCAKHLVNRAVKTHGFAAPWRGSSAAEEGSSAAEESPYVHLGH